MEGLRFPLFVQLQGRRAVVIGGGRIGGKRAKKLAQFGATVTVIDPNPCDIPGVEQNLRPYEDGDLAGAYLCVIATEDRAINEAIALEGKRLGVLVNVADNPDLCDFFFPALCQGDDLVVGLVSDGTQHHKTAAVAKKIRNLLEDETV